MSGSPTCSRRRPPRSPPSSGDHAPARGGGRAGRRRCPVPGAPPGRHPVPSQARRAARPPSACPGRARLARRRRDRPRGRRDRRDLRGQRRPEGSLLRAAQPPADPGRRLRARGRRPGRRPRRAHPPLRGRERHRRGEQREAARGPRWPAARAAWGALPVCSRAGAARTRRAAGRPGGGLTRGTFGGRIAAAPRGSNGFGYDPIFEPASEPPGGATVGEWPAERKQAVSHRARAARRMAPILERLGF